MEALQELKVKSFGHIRVSGMSSTTVRSCIQDAVAPHGSITNQVRSAIKLHPGTITLSSGKTRSPAGSQLPVMVTSPTREGSNESSEQRTVAAGGQSIVKGSFCARAVRNANRQKNRREMKWMCILLPNKVTDFFIYVQLSLSVDNLHTDGGSLHARLANSSDLFQVGCKKSI